MNFLWAIYGYFLKPLLTILVWVIVINAVLSWLVAFNVVNPQNQLVSMIGRFTYAITEPLLRPIRRFIPPLGGVDITPIILILAIIFTREYLLPELISLITGQRLALR
jgi:YggT family protein